MPKDACPARRGRATRGASPPADDGCEGDDGRRRSIDEDFAPLDLPRGLCSPSLCSPRRRHGSKQHSERLFTTRSRSARVLLRGWEHRLLSMKKRSSAAAQRAGQPATPQARRAALSLSRAAFSPLAVFPGEGRLVIHCPRGRKREPAREQLVARAESASSIKARDSSAFEIALLRAALSRSGPVSPRLRLQQCLAVLSSARDHLRHLDALAL